MSYPVPTFEELLEAVVDDYRNRVEGADVTEDSETYQFLAVVAGALWQHSWGLHYVEQQIFPDTADSTNLERWATTYELERKAAQAADDGQIDLTGTNGTVVFAGLVLVASDGTTYTTTSGGTIATGILIVTAECDQAGVVGNKGLGTTLTVQSPPVGVDGEATISTRFTSGADTELNALLLARVLARIRKGNAGGNASDYEQWALTVEGVTFAYVLPLRRGPGTVDLAVFGEDVDGNRATVSAGVRADVLAYIDTERPVTADVEVPVVTTVDVDVAVTLTVLDEGLVVADVEDDVVAAIEAVIFAVRPGGTLYFVQLQRAIAAVEGVIDFTLTDPVASVTSTVSSSLVEALKPGTIAVT